MAIKYIRASDGTGPASVATIQTTRLSGATTIDVDTVQGINATGFMGSMGTPHTFVDPVTAEEITVISEDTCVDFSGHVDGSNLEIDAIAPGQTDLGSAAGDIVIIKPTTQWADEVADTLAVAHEDDGTIKDEAVSPPGFDSDLKKGLITGVLPAVSSVTNNGQRSTDVTFASTVASYLTPGMRLRGTRGTAAPTQCTDLESSSSQYWSKSSPTGTTFTDDFCVGAWVKLESYGSDSAIISRYNGTSGWFFIVNSDGTIRLVGRNAGAANTSQILSYQSIPLNKWVHVSAQLDMSAFTATTTTSYIMIDGVNVPAIVSRGGTNPTALVQAGDLQIGAVNGASYFDGKIAQAWYSNAKITQSTVGTFMNQSMTGSETSIVSLFKFNGDGNDSNANANNLTAQNSAAATNADSPFCLDSTGTPTGSYDWGIVTQVNGATATVQHPEGAGFPTSGSISAMAYSSWKAPFGMPIDPGRWRIETIIRQLLSTSISAINNHYISAGAKIVIPIGAYKYGYMGDLSQRSSVSGARTCYLTLASSTPTSGEWNNKLGVFLYSASSVLLVTGPTYKSANERFASQTTMSMYGSISAATGTETYEVRGDVAEFIIFAELAYL